MNQNKRIVILKEGKGEIEEKRSRFIGRIYSVQSPEEAMAYVEQVRKENWDARHNCYAYTIGDRNQQQKCSDDGEPSQTAGRPMLDVLLGEEIHNAVVIVTRYFGGILLGTGGLVRAYQQAAKAAIKGCTLGIQVTGHRLLVETDYTDSGKVEYLLRQEDLTPLDTQYTDKVVFTLFLPQGREEAIQSQITEVTGGRACLDLLEEEEFQLLPLTQFEKKS